MRTIALLLTLLAVPSLARAQEPEAIDGAVIRSAQVSGLDSDRLSPGLRQDINALVGQPLARERVNALAARIEEERPDVVAAVRAVAEADGQARVVFLVARISDDHNLTANINARYVVEAVSIEGVPEAKVPQELRDQLQALVGARLDSDKANDLDGELEQALPGYDVKRRISKGTEPGKIKVVFDVTESESLRWLHFAPTRTKLVYHSDQGWSGLLDVPISTNNLRITPEFAFGDSDDLIEEYTGYGARVESRKLGIGRLGASFEASHYDQDWTAATLATLAGTPRLPGAYDQRTTVEPLVTVAISRRVRVSGGVSIVELDPPSPVDGDPLAGDSQMANAWVAAVGYGERWDAARRDRHYLEAQFTLRAASDGLESDLVYKRYFGHASYRYHAGRNTVVVTGQAGHISGDAPLFERFSLGDSTTLRGWNKYDIAPAGADEVLHGSLEARYRDFGFFFDSGSVWDRDTERKIRVSTGFGFNSDNVFMLLGFPLNTDEVRAVFMMGVRF